MEKVMIDELRALYEDIHKEIKEVVNKRRAANKTSYLFDSLSGQIKGLNEAQRLINRRIRIGSQKTKEKSPCF